MELVLDLLLGDAVQTVLVTLTRFVGRLTLILRIASLKTFEAGFACLDI